eukprot:g333.t1
MDGGSFSISDDIGSSETRIVPQLNLSATRESTFGMKKNENNSPSTNNVVSNPSKLVLSSNLITQEEAMVTPNNKTTSNRPSLTSLQQTTSTVLPSKMKIKSNEINKINHHIKEQYLKSLNYQEKKVRGIYAVQPSTKLLYKQTYGTLADDAYMVLTDKQIEAVSHEFEKQAYQDIANSVKFKTRQRNSKREWMTSTEDEHIFLRNSAGKLKNQNLKPIRKDYMLNGLTLKYEEYMEPRKDMVSELRPPPPHAPLNQHSPWREWENKKALEDGSSYRKKHDENTKVRQTIFKYTPRYHDKKFTNNENDLPYTPYPSNNKSGYATIEKIAPNSPMKITWHNNRRSNVESIQYANANASLISDGISIQEPLKYDRKNGKKYKYLQNVKQDIFLERQQYEKSKKLHFPRLDYFKPNSNSKEGYYNKSKLPMHFNDYQVQNKHAIQVEYPPALHGIALFDRKPMVTGDTMATPPAKYRERLKLLDATETWCVKNKKYLMGRGILLLTPNYEILENKHLQWVATLAGPAESPYIHGKFKITIVLNNYPTAPPKIIFNTPIFHPSIEFGADKELKIHWANGVAKFNHKLCLIAICEIVLHAMRLPETHYVPDHNAGDHRASKVWSKHTLDKRDFFVEAAFYSRKYAKADNMLQRELETNLTLMETVLSNLNAIESECLSGAYLHFCPCYSATRYGEKRGIIGGHKVYLSPSILGRKKKTKGIAKTTAVTFDNTNDEDHDNVYGNKFKIAKRMVKENEFARSHIHTDVSREENKVSPKTILEYKQRPTTAPTKCESPPLFNHGSKWKPGKRMMYSGMVKDTTIAKDRKQKPPNSILLNKSLTKEQLIKITKDEIKEFFPPSSSSSSSSDSSGIDSDGSDSESNISDDELDRESNSGYTSDVTNYHSNPNELYQIFKRNNGGNQYPSSARSDYSVNSSSIVTTSRSTASDISTSSSMASYTSRSGASYAEYETNDDTKTNDSASSIAYTRSITSIDGSFSTPQSQSSTVQTASLLRTPDVDELAEKLKNTSHVQSSTVSTHDVKRNKYGFNYHSVQSLRTIKVKGEQPMHKNDAASLTILKTISNNDDKAETNKVNDPNDMFRTKPRDDVKNYPHKFRYPINV